MTTKKSAPSKLLQKTSVRKEAPAKAPAKSSTVKSARKVDQQLARYQSMRDFSVTEEPSGKKTKSRKRGSSQLPFVIQKHAASHLHYDFRLGWNGVLKSWACAKGPSYYPGDRRLAVQVEDHPIEYGGFEGIIPKGQYGGGTVMIWDQGSWEPQAGYSDVDAALRHGSLKFTMYGKKMKGNWTLVRMNGKTANPKKPNWLLIKEHDGFERGKEAKPITEGEPDSVVTGRDLDQIAAHEDHVWRSHKAAQTKPKSRDKRLPSLTQVLKPKPKSTEGTKAKRTSPSQPTDTPKESLPHFIPPQLASLSSTPPAAPGWLHELKLDGYRIQAVVHNKHAELFTRSGLDWTDRMKSIAADVSTLPVQSAILDGEVVVLAENGTTSFADLQAAFQEGRRKFLTYFVFDLLYLDGRNLRNLPLLERKNVLSNLFSKAGGSLRFSEHIETSGDAMFQKACELHAEGIISKRADAPYKSGRSSDWLKLKCIHEQEFVIGGFTMPSKGHSGMQAVRSLLLGYYDQKKNLIYAGRTGTGFTRQTHSIIRAKLEKIRQPSNPFYRPPSEAGRGAIWVKPVLVAQVRFATWTADDLVRQASFQGLREDKPASQVAREVPSLKPRHKTPRS